MAAEDRITQILVEVDLDSTSGLERVTQVYLEVDILEPEEEGRVWGPAVGIM